MMNELKYDKSVLADYCKTNGIKCLSFFGSVLTGYFHENSDVDVLVEFEVGATPGMLGMAKIERELTEIIGRNVDLRTPAELSKYFRKNVVKESIIEYEKS